MRIRLSIGFAFFTSYAAYSMENNAVINTIPTSQETSAATSTTLLEENSPLDTVTPNQKPALKPKPAGPVQSFYRFVRILLMVLTNPQIQNSLKGIEKLLAALMQTASQVIQTAKPPTQPVVVTKTTIDFSIDPEIIKEIAADLEAQLKKNVARGGSAEQSKHAHAKDALDEDTRAIIGSVGGIVEGFCRIVEKPNDKKNVEDKIKQMCVNMGNILSTAITRYHAPVEGSLEDYERFAESLDESVKKAIADAIVEAQA